MRVEEKTVIDFLSRHFEPHLPDLFQGEEFERFVKLAQSGKDSSAAAEYERVTGAKLAECHLALTVAQAREIVNTCG